jgi:hypothetical protein
VFATILVTAVQKNNNIASLSLATIFSICTSELQPIYDLPSAIHLTGDGGCFCIANCCYAGTTHSPANCSGYAGSG